MYLSHNIRGLIWSIALILLLVFLWMFMPEMTRHGSQGLLERKDNTYIQGNTLASMSSLLPQYETELWEVCKGLGYDYDTMYALWKCEAQNMHDNIWGKAGEYGAFQFMPRTFKSFADYYGLDDANWFSFRDQATLTILMLKEGYYNQWVCWKKL